MKWLYSIQLSIPIFLWIYRVTGLISWMSENSTASLYSTRQQVFIIIRTYVPHKMKRRHCMSIKTDFHKITPCGGYCDDCSHYKNMECVGCRKNNGKCVKMWSDECDIYKCCLEHDVLFCGLCNEFPCEWIINKIGEWNPHGIEELTKLAVRYRQRKGL